MIETMNQKYWLSPDLAEEVVEQEEALLWGINYSADANFLEYLEFFQYCPYCRCVSTHESWGQKVFNEDAMVNQ